MNEFNLNRQQTPLHRAASVFAELLGMNLEEFAWVASEFNSSCGDAIPVEREDFVANWMEEVLHKYVSRDWVAGAAQVIDRAQELRPLFTVVEHVSSTANIELLRTRPLTVLLDRAGSDRLRIFYSLARWTVDKPENHDRHRHDKYHLHPLDGRGTHLGYKLLFDPLRGQSWLSWESHGKGRMDWGHPEHQVLGRRHSERLHKSSLYAVRKSVIAPKGARFNEWASLFERVGSTGRVAAPQVQTPTKWPRTRMEAKQIESARV